MRTRTRWLTITVATVLGGCTQEALLHPSQGDVQEVADSAVARAIHCASDLDQVTGYSPESAWRALHADTSPGLTTPLPAGGHAALGPRGREEIARRLQAVLDSRAVVDRASAFAGAESWPLSEVGIAEHALSLSQGLCRARDAAQALARRSGSRTEEAVSHLMTAEGARD